MTSPVQYGSVQPVQFPLGTTCQGPVWAGGSGTVTVVNQDNKYYAYIGYTNSIAPGGTNTAPIGPGASMTFPGDRSLYAVGQNASMEPLLLMPGAIQYSPPTPTATSLVNAGGTGSANVAFTVPPSANGNTVILPLTDVTDWNSYDINLYAYGPTNTTTGAEALCLVFQWFDDLTSGIPVFQEEWWVWTGYEAINGPLGGPRYNPLAGNGPMHGRYMQISAVNVGGNTTPITIQWLNLFASPRTVPYSDWRQSIFAMYWQSPGSLIDLAYIPIDYSGHNTISAAPLGGGFENQLLTLNGYEPGAGEQGYLLPLYAGPVSINYEIANAVASNSPRLISLADTVGSQLNGVPFPGTLIIFPNVLNSTYQGILELPRAPCLFVCSFAATTAITLSITAQQAALCGIT